MNVLFLLCVPLNVDKRFFKSLFPVFIHICTSNTKSSLLKWCWDIFTLHVWKIKAGYYEIMFVTVIQLHLVWQKQLRNICLTVTHAHKHTNVKVKALQKELVLHAAFSPINNQDRSTAAPFLSAESQNRQRNLFWQKIGLFVVFPSALMLLRRSDWINEGHCLCRAA